MKKILFAAAFVMLLGTSIAVENRAIGTEYAYSADWEDYATVTAVKFTGRMTVRNHSIKVQKNESGDLRAYSGGWRPVSGSDRSGYMYMFYDGSSVWYFNL